MYSELFVAQHHAAHAAGGAAPSRTQIGYFTSFDEAATALNDKYAPGCWQGIERDATHERWWRDDSTPAWQGPTRRRAR